MISKSWKGVAGDNGDIPTVAQWYGKCPNPNQINIHNGHNRRGLIEPAHLWRFLKEPDQRLGPCFMFFIFAHVKVLIPSYFDSATNPDWWFSLGPTLLLPGSDAIAAKSRNYWVQDQNKSSCFLILIIALHVHTLLSKWSTTASQFVTDPLLIFTAKFPSWIPITPLDGLPWSWFCFALSWLH